jgi:hypothetical protein
MEDLLYHNVYRTKVLESILQSGKIIVDEKLEYPSIALTRNKDYLSHRGIQIVINRNRLKSYAKVKPFCFFGYLKVNNIPTKLKQIDEFEERCYSDIILDRCCIYIKIDRKIHPNLELNHPLIINKF